MFDAVIEEVGGVSSDVGPMFEWDGWRWQPSDRWSKLATWGNQMGGPLHSTSATACVTASLKDSRSHSLAWKHHT